MSEELSKNPKDSSHDSKTFTKCSALIPDDLLERLKEAGYDNRAEAIRLGLECLLKEDESPPDSYETLQQVVKNLNESIGKQRDSYKILEESFTTQGESYKTLKESFLNQKESLSVLQAINGELVNHNESLKRELIQAHKDKDDLKVMYGMNVNLVKGLNEKIDEKILLLEDGSKKKSRWWKFW